jgi:hypothetical protein
MILAVPAMGSSGFTIEGRATATGDRSNIFGVVETCGRSNLPASE